MIGAGKYVGEAANLSWDIDSEASDLALAEIFVPWPKKKCVNIFL